MRIGSVSCHSGRLFCTGACCWIGHSPWSPQPRKRKQLRTLDHWRFLMRLWPRERPLRKVLTKMMKFPSVLHGLLQPRAPQVLQDRCEPRVQVDPCDRPPLQTRCAPQGAPHREHRCEVDLQTRGCHQLCPQLQRQRCPLFCFGHSQSRCQDSAWLTRIQRPVRRLLCNRHPDLLAIAIHTSWLQRHRHLLASPPLHARCPRRSSHYRRRRRARLAKRSTRVRRPTHLLCREHMCPHCLLRRLPLKKQVPGR